MEFSSSQQRVRPGDTTPRQPISNNATKDIAHKRNHATLQIPLLGKRSYVASREPSRNRSNPTIKRARQASPMLSSQLCEECSRINWTEIDEWLKFGGRIDWSGVLVARVGKRYRNVSSSTTCSLCRQLHAPWIEPFLRSQSPTNGKTHDFGDRIHIFRHLRHLPHVNDFQTSRNELRKHNAPYHIAVVPDGREWRDELRAHLATHGMVVVMPRGHSESEVFVPQQVSATFDHNIVRPWLRRCKHHKTLCNPKAPEVIGMKLIDCESEDRIIRNYCPDDRYVALSYVWGDTAASKTPVLTPSKKQNLQRKVDIKSNARRIPSVPRTLQPISKPKLEHPRNNFVHEQTFAMALKKVLPSTAAPRTKPVLHLPKDIPLTIQDAIRVTKALGYRFLWVDKYCIDQSNEFEKQQQCNRMGDIYGGSQLTIFALGEDSEYGMPGVSSRPRVLQQQSTTTRKYTFISTMPDPHLSIKESKWSSRGWTYQEGLFSTRRLFFTDFQLYFECNAMNCVESFKSNLKSLHIQTGQRFRAYHRAGKFVCGNSNQYSHLDVKRNAANHRKVDTIRRCQYQIRQYTKRELTNKDDVLQAFAGIARFYARTTTRIVSLAGIPIPYPIAKLPGIDREFRDHLSYALAWTHRVQHSDGMEMENINNQSDPRHGGFIWPSHRNIQPQRRKGFPSWSWAGWVGEIGRRDDLPYCWTSHLTCVSIVFRGGESEDYEWLQGFAQYKQYIIRRLLTASILQFDAYVLNPEKLKLWQDDPRLRRRQLASHTTDLYMSTGPSSMKELHHELKDGQLECLVLGTHGEPRKDIFHAIRIADRKSSKAQKRRIDLFRRVDPDAIICVIVHTVNGVSHRIGLLKVRFIGGNMERALQDWTSGSKKRFVLK